MILNLKGLNKFIEYHHFKMESLSTVISLVKRNCYMASVDLKDAYYSVPIANEHQKYLKFLWRGELYKFVCFPNGLAFCPRKFTKLLKPISSSLRQLGHLSVGHTDDSYLKGDDYSDCAKNVLATIKLFDSLGFTVHPSKSSFIPTQKLIILGFLIDSVEMKVYPTAEKIKTACQELLTKSSPRLCEVASVLGFLISVFPAALYGHLHFREHDMDKTEALKLHKGNFEKPMCLSDKACSDLNWWINFADSLHKPISNTLPEITLFTDASNHGWGAVLNNCPIGGKWTPLEANNHINYLEMLAVFLALTAFHSHLSGKHVSVRIDNMTAVADIGKMGTSHSRKRNALTRNIWDWCEQHNVFLTTAHIAGKDNSIADAESRKSRKDLEWSLNTNIFENGICQLGVKPAIDLFASRLNYKIKPFISYQPDPEAEIINTFTVSWQPYLFYAFPPFSLITLVLQKIQEEHSTRVIVVPQWPTQPWWPVLMRMIVQQPLILPRTKQTLLLPTNPDLLHPIHKKLTLLMCHLSGDPSKINAFHAKLCPSSCHPGDKARNSNTSRTSVSGSSTVVAGKLITFQLL
jgi:hypothetical protein